MKYNARSKRLDIFVYVLPMFLSFLPITSFFGWVVPLILFLGFGEYGRVSEHVRQSLIIFLALFILNVLFLVLLPGGMTDGGFYATCCFALLFVSNSTFLIFGLISLVATILAEFSAAIGIYCIIKNKEIVLPLITKLALKVRRKSDFYSA